MFFRVDWDWPTEDWKANRMSNTLAEMFDLIDMNWPNQYIYVGF